jgi:hypothetical protein
MHLPAGESGSRSLTSALSSSGGELSMPVGAPARALPSGVCEDITKYLDMDSGDQFRCLVLLTRVHTCKGRQLARACLGEKFIKNKVQGKRLAYCSSGSTYL